MRCFIAVPVPEDLKDRILEVQKKLEKSEADLKSIKKENLHLTIKFLGEISDEQIEEVKGFLSGLKEKSFEILIKDLGVFPNEDYIKVIWLDIKENQDILLKLMEKADENLCHIRDDKRKPVTHLTVARVGGFRNKEKLKALIQELKDVEIGRMTVGVLKLMASELTPEGPIYKDLAEFELK